MSNVLEDDDANRFGYSIPGLCLDIECIVSWCLYRTDNRRDFAGDIYEAIGWSIHAAQLKGESLPDD